LGYYFFGTAVSTPILPTLTILLSVTGTTVLAGMLGCWGMFRRSALDALRAEA
jgi:hypothetical protein